MGGDALRQGRRVDRRRAGRESWSRPGPGAAWPPLGRPAAERSEAGAAWGRPRRPQRGVAGGSGDARGAGAWPPQMPQSGSWAASEASRRSCPPLHGRAGRPNGARGQVPPHPMPGQAAPASTGGCGRPAKLRGERGESADASGALMAAGILGGHGPQEWSGATSGRPQGGRRSGPRRGEAALPPRPKRRPRGGL